MKARTTLILTVIAAGLLFIALKANQSDKSRESLAGGPIFPELQIEAVADIQLASSDAMVHMIKNPDGWLVTTEGNNQADTLAVQSLLEKLEFFDRKHLRSTSPGKQATFEVDEESGTDVIIADTGGRTLAHFRVGKNGPDHRSQYIRPAGSNEVFCIPEYLKSIFDAERPTWREKSMFKFDMNQVKEIEINPSESNPVVLTRNIDGNFTMSEPESAAVIQNIVTSSLRSFSNLKCDAFPDSLPSRSQTGLDPPLQQLTVKLNDGATYTLLVGYETEGTKHYVSARGTDTIALLSKGRIGNLIHTAQELIERSPEPEPELTPETTPEPNREPTPKPDAQPGPE